MLNLFEALVGDQTSPNLPKTEWVSFAIPVSGGHLVVRENISRMKAYSSVDELLGDFSIIPNSPGVHTAEREKMLMREIARDYGLGYGSVFGHLVAYSGKNVVNRPIAKVTTDGVDKFYAHSTIDFMVKRL